MMEEWPFKHIGPDGKTYLHDDNWAYFRKEIEARGDHNWHHQRIFLKLFNPANGVSLLPGYNGDTYFMRSVFDDFCVVYEPFPAWVRTEQDPDALEPSWNLFIENGHKKTPGEPIILFSSMNVLFPFYGEAVVYAYFRDKYWLTADMKDYGIGTFPPTNTEEKRRRGRYLVRDITEPFTQDW